jgi:CheY-like chemotaxis protein
MDILLIEDSKFLRLATERALVKAGYKVTGAGDGQEALQIARQNLPNLILLDMMLPKMTGLDVLQALKKDPLTVHIPVIILSALSQKSEKKLLEAGAAAYFEKSEKMLGENARGLIQLIEGVLAKAKQS